MPGPGGHDPRPHGGMGGMGGGGFGGGRMMVPTAGRFQPNPNPLQVAGQQTLVVTVHKCTQLKSTQLLGKQDPYVRVTLYRGQQRVAQIKTQTHTNGGRNPSFEDRGAIMNFVLPDGTSLGELSLVFDVFNANMVSDDMIGSTGRMQLDPSTLGGQAAEWRVQTGGTIQVDFQLQGATRPQAPQVAYGVPSQLQGAVPAQPVPSEALLGAQYGMQQPYAQSQYVSPEQVDPTLQPVHGVPLAVAEPVGNEPPPPGYTPPADPAAFGLPPAGQQQQQQQQQEGTKYSAANPF